MDEFFNTTQLYENQTCPIPPMHPAITAMIELTHIAIFIVGLLGNTLVIYVVLRFSKMQTVTNLYILNLAIADECFLIGIPFLVTTTIYRTWLFGAAMCKIYMTMIGINQFTSSIFLTIMSADRYIAVCHPISSPKFRTPFISKIVSALAWIISALLIIPIILYSNVVDDGPENVPSCNIIWPTGNHENRTSNSTDSIDQPEQVNTFTLYSFVYSFAIPLTLILIFYVLVIRKLKTVGPKNKSKEKKKSHRKVTKLVLTVITVYVLCWLPYWVAQLVLIFRRPEGDEDMSRCQTDGVSLFLLTHLITSILSNANSAMNPLLYAFLSDNFKKSFLKACTCAAGKEVNCTLHIENSVFPKRQNRGSERLPPGGRRGTTLCVPGEDFTNEEAQLVSKADASTLTTRSNTTFSTDVTKDTTSGSSSKEELLKNGLKVLSEPTAV